VNKCVIDYFISSVPGGTGHVHITVNPPLKRWAIFNALTLRALAKQSSHFCESTDAIRIWERRNCSAGSVLLASYFKKNEDSGFAGVRTGVRMKDLRYRGG
jgi:hypothetical protein